MLFSLSDQCRATCAARWGADDCARAATVCGPRESAESLRCFTRELNQYPGRSFDAALADARGTCRLPTGRDLEIFRRLRAGGQ